MTASTSALDRMAEDQATILMLGTVLRTCRDLHGRCLTSPAVLDTLGVLRRDKAVRAIAALDYEENIRKQCGEYFDLLYGQLKAVAFAHGYALAFHGSLARDIDLVACPWTEAAADQAALAEAIRARAAELNGGVCFENPKAGNKPHGRVAFSFHLGGGPFIDLSVMAPMAPSIEAVPVLLDALKEAVAAIRVFHGVPAWPIYETHAPEMKRIKAAIALGEGALR
jgi:hypothetical protein